VTLNVLQNTPLLNELTQAVNLSEAAVTLISRAAMFALPEKQLKTYLPDALYFQRAIQTFVSRISRLKCHWSPRWVS
jgi:hypothetical protein